MGWHANPDLTLARETGVPTDRIAIAAALDLLERCGEEPLHLGQHLRDALETGLVPVSALLALGRLCHQDGAGRDEARAASDAIFGLVLPTPVEGRDTEFFWRVARSLSRADAEYPNPTRTMAFRTFLNARDAAAFATRVDERLFNITEGSASLVSNYTVWYWE